MWGERSLLYSRMDVLLMLIRDAHPSCGPARMVRYKMGPYMHWDIWCHDTKKKGGEGDEDMIGKQMRGAGKTIP